MKISFDGNITSSDKLSFDSLYRAVFFGDGLFESIYAEEGYIYLFEEHLSRLKKGMKSFKLENEFIENKKLILSHITDLVSEFPEEKCFRIKILLWRKGKGTYNPGDNKEAHLLILTEESREFQIEEISELDISEKVLLSKSKYSQHKSISAKDYLFANLEKKEKSLDEILVGNEQGTLIEASSSNIFLQSGKNIFYPKVGSGQINGIMAEYILQTGCFKGFILTEKDLNIEDVRKADIVYFTNSFGIRYLKQNDKTEIPKSIAGIKTSLPKQPLPL